ncbi:ferredoxin [Aequitasia blattaphilus]|uniref:Ferredoxin n=1 Tax=Aequitasia blattaphilus TaxID=2949332 RepID=A0ABT1EAV9_9FIRM|nr:ferredoxin [Aequitasia blattaphilus]MCP1102821.1 ferredoxin [Aequitasia blattaphilus]MCR8615461.1 ferredoxin [Aequitasia blattaphilus]
MNAVVNDGCISCGVCATVCSEVFQMNENDVAEVVLPEVPEEYEEAVKAARDGCPAGVIEVTE